MFKIILGCVNLKRSNIHKAQMAVIPKYLQPKEF